MDIQNPNEAGLPALTYEDGIKRAALGVYSKFGLEYWWLALSGHNAMGDATFISAGNFSWRWMNQTSKITLSSGTVLTPPQGKSQPEELRARNARSYGNDNAFYNEWSAIYLVNNQCNLLLSAIENPDVKFTGDADTKRSVVKAWAYWWKGFAYSRIGSLYTAGIITDQLNETNNNYVSSAAMIAEANKNFDLAKSELDKATNEASFNDMMKAMVPSFAYSESSPITAAMWKRQINTYKARNLLVNKKMSDMTTADWNTIISLTNDGVLEGDNVFIMKATADPDDQVSTGWTAYRLLSFGWEFISERLVQDFKNGDARYTRNITALSSPVVNRSGRGYQYGTRWAVKDIVSGGDWASTTYEMASIPIGVCYEENALMKAEALIKTSQIDAGLTLVDAVRDYQNASLAHVSGTSLNAAQAYEELRKERRIGLFNKNVAFYDARRWNVSSSDGGRTGAVVIGPGAVVDNNATIYYNYLDYWDVPANELDFNTPASGSSEVVSPK
ncbi:MAG: hypothetical protein ACK5NK_01085 [Niabella sp.]